MTTPKHDDRSALVDPRIAAAWGAASNEEPPASIDAAILAAARREVAAGPEPIDTRETRADRRRWWPLAAAATIAAVVIGVLQVTPTDKLGAPATDTAVVSDVPTPATKPAPEGTTSVPSSKEGQPARSDDTSVRSEARSMEAPRQPAFASAPKLAVPLPAAAPEPTQEGLVAAPAAIPDPFPAAPKPAADAAPATSGQLAASPPSPSPPPRAEAAANVSPERDQVARQAAAPPPAGQSAAATAAERAAAPAPSSLPLGKMAAGRADSGVDEARVKDRTPLPVPEWIALIRRLRTEGKQAEAAKELAAFRATHADHDKLLPADLRDWRPPER